MKIEPVTLEGTAIRLEPMEDRHIGGLLAAADAPHIFDWVSFAFRSREDIARFVRRTSKLCEQGLALPFAIVEKESNKAIGGTGFWHVEAPHRKLEIGGSWLNPRWQRTRANTEAKYLLLSHAFDRLGCIRVGFVTDVLNEPSKAALRRIGAVEEGILRNHMIQPDGRRRHSVSYSIIAEEWPTVRSRLESLLSAHRTA
jgi:N-acetyltransferase